ncbi:uncharacterized protein PHACADRAFT_132640, partial [Phanerochaete carnosa HHB-10118-sp]
LDLSDTICTLGSVAGNLHTNSDEPTVTIIASFEGHPANNTAHLFEQLSSLVSKGL